MKKAGNFSLLFRESGLAPAKSGAIPLRPGDPAHSELLRRVASRDDDERMPPPKHGPALSTAEVGLLAAWIQAGAPWDGHWAYTAPRAPMLPVVRDATWCRAPLDRFVLARLEKESLHPSPEADRIAWLRRASLDLTGLPPTPDDIAAFGNDRGSGAHERVVDGLLKSAAYGERWAAVWLDLARYADSQGYEKDAARVAWPWRDWVIRAFDGNLPFDRFTVRLLAGDLLPDATLDDAVASAFHRHTPTNAEGGTDDEEVRVAAVLDRVATTWKAWQGVTFNCVQCHAHPYDPIDHAEYYRFAALFNTSRDWDLNNDEPRLVVPLRHEAFGRARALDRSLRALRAAELDETTRLAADAGQWRCLAPVAAASSHMTKLAIRALPDGGGEVWTEGTVSHDSTFTLEFAAPTAGQRVAALRIDALPRDSAKALLTAELGFVLSEVRAQRLGPSNASAVAAHETRLQAARDALARATEAESKAADADREAARKETAQRRQALRDLEARHPGEVKLAFAFGDEAEPFMDAQSTLDPDTRGWGALSRMTHPRRLVIVPDQPFDLEPGGKLRLVIRQEAAPNDMAPLVMNRGRFSVTDRADWTRLAAAPGFAARRAEMARLGKERADIPGTPLPVMAEQDPHLRRPTALFVRGDWLNKGEVVQPGVPRVFPALPADAPADRLALARWLVSPSNPLTARVAVNRLWEQLFGTGIVETVDDFGTSGQPPSHPELLDHLALRFRDDLRWDVKALLREIVLSATYRQDARVTPLLRERDPANRLLARGPRSRLSAEMVRDNALAIAGLLSSKRFGPPAMPVQPEGIWRVVYSSQRWVTSEGEDAYRRALYTYWRRSAPYPSLLTFDAPNRIVCAARRGLTATPLQALVTLNDPVFVECASALARRMEREAGPTLHERIARGLVLATGRAADPADVADLRRLHAQALATYSRQPDLAVRFGAEPEQAALALVANAILNLDTVLSK